MITNSANWKRIKLHRLQDCCSDANHLMDKGEWINLIRKYPYCCVAFWFYNSQCANTAFVSMCVYACLCVKSDHKNKANCQCCVGNKVTLKGLGMLWWEPQNILIIHSLNLIYNMSESTLCILHNFKIINKNGNDCPTSINFLI